VVFVLLILGCGSGQKPLDDTAFNTEPDDTDVGETIPAECAESLPITWDDWGRDFFRTWCGGCHSAETPDRRGAPEAYVFDTEAQVFSHRDIIYWSVLEQDRMPLGGGLVPEEAELLSYYINCVLTGINSRSTP
jgi:uncharacterized membrane protein